MYGMQIGVTAGEGLSRESRPASSAVSCLYKGSARRSSIRPSRQTYMYGFPWVLCLSFRCIFIVFFPYFQTSRRYAVACVRDPHQMDVPPEPLPKKKKKSVGSYRRFVLVDEFPHFILHNVIWFLLSVAARGITREGKSSRDKRSPNYRKPLRHACQ